MAGKKKNIVFIVNEIIMGGVGVILINLLRSLEPAMYNITLLIQDDYGDKNVLLSLVPTNIKTKFLRSASLIEEAAFYRGKKRNVFQKIYYNYFLWKFRRATLKLFNRCISEVRRSHGYIDAFIDFGYSDRRYIKKITAKKKIVWRHGSLLAIKPEEITRFTNYWKTFDKIVVVCNDMYKQMKKNYPNLASKTFVAYNPIDLERVLSLSNNEAESSDESYLHEDYIVTVTRIDFSSKDYNTLIKAYKIAKESWFNWKLYIVGDGSDREKVAELIEKNGLSNDIIMLGNKNNPYVIMKKAKFFILSSKTEGLPTVLIEALALGVPVVSSDCQIGPREILQDGKYGVLVPVGDAQAMADKFMELYNKPDLREKYAKIGKERAQDFSIDNTMKVIEQIIND